MTLDSVASRSLKSAEGIGAVVAQVGDDPVEQRRSGVRSDIAALDVDPDGGVA